MELTKKLIILSLASFSGCTAIKSAEVLTKEQAIESTQQGGLVLVGNRFNIPITLTYLKNGEPITILLEPKEKVELGKVEEVENIVATLPPTGRALHGGYIPTKGFSARLSMSDVPEGRPAPGNNIVFMIENVFPPSGQEVRATTAIEDLPPVPGGGGFKSLD